MRRTAKICVGEHVVRLGSRIACSSSWVLDFQNIQAAQAERTNCCNLERTHSPWRNQVRSLGIVPGPDDDPPGFPVKLPRVTFWQGLSIEVNAGRFFLGE